MKAKNKKRGKLRLALNIILVILIIGNLLTVVLSFILRSFIFNLSPSADPIRLYIIGITSAVNVVAFFLILKNKKIGVYLFSGMTILTILFNLLTQIPVLYNIINVVPLIAVLLICLPLWKDFK